MVPWWIDRLQRGPDGQVEEAVAVEVALGHGGAEVVRLAW
jgi:hypothetical protein